MADSVTVQLKGATDTVAAFQELREFIRGNLFTQSVRAAARLMLDEIHARVPVLTGNLVSNLRVVTSRRRDEVRGRVVVNMAGDKTNAFYWRFVEFGHRTRNDGGIGFVRPRPFVTPAFEAKKEPAAQVVIDKFAEGLERAELRARRAK